MTLLTLVMIVGLLALVGNWLTKRWEARQPVLDTPVMTAEQGADAVGASRITSYTNALRMRLSAVQANLLGAKPAPVATQFRLWLAAALGTEPALHHWLMSLSDEQLNALAMHIERFTREMGFELSWLLNQEVTQQPALARALTTVVLDYCRACHHAVTLQEELEVYKALRAYQENPNSVQNREFGQALFGRLLEQGLISIKVADHLALPEPQRRQQIVDLISQVAAEKQATLQRIVKEMITQSHGTAESTPAATVALNGAVSQATP